MVLSTTGYPTRRHQFYTTWWVLKNSDKTLIFGSTVPLVFRLKSYLNSLLPADSNRDIRIRTHTGLNWADDKLETLADIVNNTECQIIVATAGLAQGNDIRVIKTVIQIGEPESIEMYVQKPGRARPGIDKPRAIFYISSNRMDLAAKIVQQTDEENDSDAKKARIDSEDVAFDRRNSDCQMQTCGAGSPVRQPEK